MNCEDVNRNAIAFVDGRLDDDRARLFVEHLDGCEECRALVAGQRAVASVLASRPECGVAPSLLAKVNASIDEESGWWGVVDWHWLAVRCAPVAATILLAAAVLVGRTSSTESSTKISLSHVIESWAAGDTQNVPVPSVLWQPKVNEDSMLLAVLAAPPDATISETRK